MKKKNEAEVHDRFILHLDRLDESLMDVAKAVGNKYAVLAAKYEAAQLRVAVAREFWSNPKQHAKKH